MLNYNKIGHRFFLKFADSLQKVAELQEVISLEIYDFIKLSANFLQLSVTFCKLSFYDSH